MAKVLPAAAALLLALLTLHASTPLHGVAADTSYISQIKAAGQQHVSLGRQLQQDDGLEEDEFDGVVQTQQGRQAQTQTQTQATAGNGPTAASTTTGSSRVVPATGTPAGNQQSGPQVIPVGNQQVAAGGTQTVPAAGTQTVPAAVSQTAAVADPDAPKNGWTATASAPTIQATSQPKSNRTKKATFENNVITFAPKANVTFGDDVDDEGKCSAEAEKYCKDVDEGDGKLAECLSNAIALSENPDTGDGAEDVPQISDACREEVYQYKISRNTNINKNVPLAMACKLDAEKFCNTTWFFGYQTGLVIGCLRENKNSLAKDCRKELTKVQKDAAEDIRSDPALWEACKDDAANLCKDVKFGGGRVQACLRDNRMKLSWSCDDQLFRQEIENADDIRLSVRLYSKCMPDKRKFCKDVEPGNARTKDCLEEHREQLSGPCRQEIDSMIERRSRDFRLDPKLKGACESEIANMCAYFGDLDDVDTFDSSVINCLQDYRDQIKSQECKRQVQKYLVLEAQDIRFDVTLAEACYEDRQKYCSNVPPGSARVIRCLSRQREKLSPVCRVTLFDEEVKFSENIDFQYPMKEACQNELAKFCKDVPHGNARAIRCLQDNKDQKDFSRACKAEVMAYEAEIGKDYRLNFRLAKNCDKDIKQLCPNICSQNDGDVCGGKVLRCLTDKMDEISVDACRKEVFYYQKMEVENFQNDIILAEACRQDVDKYCANVEHGEGRVHQCLRDNRKKLSEECRKEELMLEEREAGNIELSQGLMRSCKAERQLFCRDVKPGSARVFRCLAENMNDADFGNNCKYQVMYKLQRRQSNWKLDPPLRKACRADVRQLCATEDAANSEQGLVYKCLIKKEGEISEGCRRELGRAVHMALFVWQRGAILTSDCDADIDKYCLAARPNMESRPGAVGSCLAGILERQDGLASSKRRLAAEPQQAPQGQAIQQQVDTPQPRGNYRTDSQNSPNNNYKALQGAKLSEQCYALADIAEPPNMRKIFDESLTVALVKSQLDKIDRVTGSVAGLVTRNNKGRPEAISLTGWVALMGVAAMVSLITYGTFLIYKRMRGIPDKDYTLVVKTQHK